VRDQQQSRAENDDDHVSSTTAPPQKNDGTLPSTAMDVVSSTKHLESLYTTPLEQKKMDWLHDVPMRTQNAAVREEDELLFPAFSLRFDFDGLVVDESGMVSPE